MIVLAGCAKQEAIPQTKTIDSLEYIIAGLKTEIENLNAHITQQTKSESTTTKTVSDTSGQATQFSEDQKSEWKKVRNGAKLNVDWKMKVISADNDNSLCWLQYIYYDEGKMKMGQYDYDCQVNVYNSNSTLHNGDIIVVKGKASGVDENGGVRLIATKVINKGVE